MYKSTFLFLLLTACSFFQSQKSNGQYLLQKEGAEDPIQSRTIAVPYVFSSETLGFGLGLGSVYSPISQPQSTYYGTVYGTDNGSWLFMLGGNALRLPRVSRLFIRPFALVSQDTEMRLYIEGNPTYAGIERAGSNESSADNYIVDEIREAIIDVEMRYILPTGHYRDTPIHTYITQNGILKENPSGATSINPFESGKSSLLFRPYYRKQISPSQGAETLFFQLGIEHDNRDYVPNPHRGYLTKASISHDFDWLGSSHNWTALEGEFDGYIPLWDASWSRQQTLAISAWASYAPSYDASSPSPHQKPPYFAGPTLGGLWRLRGYPSYRFHDKSAIHYTAEYRVMPEWQPFGSIDLLDPLMIRWWQIVGLVEAGRVAPNWDVKTLHTNMKYDFGVGLRGMFDSAIGRIDFVWSEEGVSFTAMLGQTF